MIDMGHDLARALDPVLLARDAGIKPDPWQASVLRSEAKRSLLWSRGRAASPRLAVSVDCIGQSISRARQLSSCRHRSASRAEMQRSVMQHCSKLRRIPGLRQETIMRSEFDNGSRIPGVAWNWRHDPRVSLRSIS